MDASSNQQHTGSPVEGQGGCLAHANCDACGARALQLPMTPERVKNALKTA